METKLNKSRNKVIKKETVEEKKLNESASSKEKTLVKDENKEKDLLKISSKDAVSIDRALNQLRNFGKKNFVQTVDLIINLQKFDSRKESLNSFIQVPHIYERKIAAFLNTELKGFEVIPKDSFESYKTLRDAKRLAKKYSLFIASAPLMGLIATKFGRALGPSGKMPSPQLGIVVKEDEETIKKLMEKMKKSIKIKTKEKVIKIGIGKEDMKDEQLKENILAAIRGIIDLLPQKKDNFKSALIKFTMTPSIRIKYEE